MAFLCATCGKPALAWLIFQDGHFCSARCRDRAAARAARALRNRLQRQGPPEPVRKCAFCREPLGPERAAQNNPFCSPLCQRKAKEQEKTTRRHGSLHEQAQAANFFLENRQRLNDERDRTE